MADRWGAATSGRETPWGEAPVGGRTQVVVFVILGGSVIALLGIGAVWLMRLAPTEDLPSAERELGLLKADPAFATVPTGTQLADEERRPVCSNLESDRIEPYVRRTYEVSGPMAGAVRSLRSALESGGWSEYVDRLATGGVSRTYMRRFDGLSARIDVQAYGSESILVERRGELDVTAHIVDPSFCTAP